MVGIQEATTVAPFNIPPMRQGLGRVTHVHALESLTAATNSASDSKHAKMSPIDNKSASISDKGKDSESDSSPPRFFPQCTVAV